ncbi:MAG: hypothetical protein QXW78_04470 [Candidatus Thermoplasmatota archaeon]
MDIEEFAKKHLIPISLITVSLFLFFYLIYFHRIFLLIIAIYALLASILILVSYTGKTLSNYLRERKFHKRLKKEIEKFKE